MSLSFKESLNQISSGDFIGNGGNWQNHPSYTHSDIYTDRSISTISSKKNIRLNSRQFNITQEENSQYIPFEMPRFYDGLDLVNATISIHYETSGERHGAAQPINVIYNDNKIRFGWLIDSNVTSDPGKLKFEIHAYGVAHGANGETTAYVWKSKSNEKLNVLESICRTDEVITEVDGSWVQELVTDITERVAESLRDVALKEQVQTAVQDAKQYADDLNTTTSNKIKSIDKEIDVIFDEIENFSADSVQYVAQKLTDAQMAQARKNINANGFDWHAIGEYNGYAANMGNYNSITDWDRLLAVPSSVSSNTPALGVLLTAVSILLMGDNRSISKESALKDFNAAILDLSNAGISPSGYRIVHTLDVENANKYLFVVIQHNASNNRWILTDQTDDVARFIAVTGDEIINDTTLIYPDTTLSIDGRAADAKAVGQALVLKAELEHDHKISNIDGLQEVLDNKASSLHDHDGDYDAKGAADNVLTIATKYVDEAIANANNVSSWNDLEDKPFYQDGETIIPLDEKFIPDTIARVSDVEELLGDFDPDTSCVDINFEGAEIGEANPINADTLGGILASDYATKSYVDSKEFSGSNISVPTKLSQLEEDVTHRLVTDFEKTAWNNKSDFSGNYNDLINKPQIPTVPTKVSDFENDAKYLTESNLQTATNNVLAQAKISGEFDGEKGADGVSPIVAISKSGQVTTVTITDKNGTKTATINDGAKGDPFTYNDFTPEQLASLKGEKGDTGKDGTSVNIKGSVATSANLSALTGLTVGDGYITEDNGHLFVYNGTTFTDVGEIRGPQGLKGDAGTSATHRWDGTTLYITTASGTSSANLKGEKGDDGYTPVKGKDYSDGAAGKDGVSPTVSVSKNGKITTVSITDVNGTKTATINDGNDGAKGDPFTYADFTAEQLASLKGDKGNDGYTPVKGKDYFDGEKGADGVSTTHSWNGTTLTITSASGTSSANLKGEKGDTGSAGKDGTSVTVSNVTTSTADGGSNVVTFSDGKTLTVKNGSKGSTGAAGTSVTVSNISESTADGGNNVVTFSDGKTVTIKNGSKGSTGESGADGQRGFSILKVTTAPSSYTTAIGGFTPTHRIDLSTVKTQSQATEVLVGDTLAYNYYQYLIGYVDSSYVYLGSRSSVRGATGATPAKGTDYFTETDKAEMVADVVEEMGELGYVQADLTGGEESSTPATVNADTLGGIPASKYITKEHVSEAVSTEFEDEKGNMVQLLISELQGLPVFGVVDANNTITVTSQLSAGVYTLKYENDNGDLVDIGTITIDKGKIAIVNLLTTALTPDDITTIFDGNGYKNGYYASAAEPFYNTDSAFFCTGLMVIPENKTFYIKGCTIDTTLSHTRFGFMHQDGRSFNTAVLSNWGTAITVTELGAQYYSISIDANYTLNGAHPYYFYFSASGTGDNVVVAATPITDTNGDSGGDTQVVVNLLKSAVGAQGTVLNDVGYIDGYYLSGNANVSGNNSYLATDNTHFTTGFIPYTKSQAQAGIPIYIKGITLDTSQSHTRMGAYPNYDYATYIDPIKFSAGTGYIVAEKISDKCYKITVTSQFISEVNNDFNYVRFSFTGSGAGVIITVNQEIL